MNLFDAFVIDGVRRTADGYLAAHAKVARTGIQIYKGSELGKPELDKVRVYRPPEEVFHADALKSFAHRPVTLKHPNVPVTARNWKKFAGGQTGDKVVRDGEYVSVPMVMMDQKLIDAYEKDGVKELSMGYSTDIQWRTGVTDAGEPYDAVQTAIRGNHLAVVPQARGGDKLRLGDQGDTKTCPQCGSEVSDDADSCPQCGYQFDEDDDNLNYDSATGEYPMKLIIDGLPVNVADERDGAIIDKHIAMLTKKLNDGIADLEEYNKKKKKDDEDVADAKKAIDTKDGEIAVLKQQLKDAAITPEKLDVMVKDRVAVIDAARTLVGDKYVFDGKTLDVIRKDAVATKLGDAVATMPVDAISGAFMALTKDAKPAHAATQIADVMRQRPSGVYATDAREAAYDKMVTNLQDAWKTPASAPQH